MSQAFNDLANSIDSMNRAKAARRQAEEDFALWTGRAALMKCLYQSITDASHPLKIKEVRDRIEETAAWACRRGKVAPDQDPHEVLADLQEEHQKAIAEAEAFISKPLVTDGFFRLKWHIGGPSGHSLPHKTTQEQAVAVQQRAIAAVKKTPFGQRPNTEKIVREAMR